MATAVKSRSRREACIEYVWDRCVLAWNDGDMEQAFHLYRMLVMFESMTDDEYVAITSCNCEECTCAH